MGPKLTSDPEYKTDLECSIAVQGSGKGPFACVMRYQGESRNMLIFLYQRYCTTNTYSKGTVHSTLELLKYTGQLMHRWFAKWESFSAQLASMVAPTDEGLLVTMITEFLGEDSKLAQGAVILHKTSRRTGPGNN